ncbi:MAG: PcfJ domain-containing protein [Clostridiales bacterium]|nr:PcfJ domain-containing protein [Clostridiales bacterium]
MKEFIRIEYMLHSCPQIDPCDERFPLVSEDVLERERKKIGKGNDFGFFPNVSLTDDVQWFVEFYFIAPHSYRRFIVMEGQRMPLDDLLDLLSFTRSSGLFYIDHFDLKKFIRKVNDVFPSWHVGDFDSLDAGMMIEHIYFASHRSGAREILYKAGLDYIAWNLHEIRVNDLIGNSPEEIISPDMSLKLLRILNDWPLVTELYSVEKKERCIGIYNKFNSYIGQELPSYAQWKYLERLYVNGTFGGKPFKRSLYNRLRSALLEKTLNDYEKYFELLDQIPSRRRRRLPDAYDIDGEVDNMNKYLESKDKIRKYGSTERERYEFRDKDYSVILPDTVSDIYDEACSQKNCLMDLVDDYLDGKTTILFLRKTGEEGKSFVTMEIRDDEIVQVYKWCNYYPEPAVYDFLEVYSKKRGFIYDLEKLIDTGECFKELKDYVEKHTADPLNKLAS